MSFLQCWKIKQIKLYSFISHIKFLTKATNQHGVHSPFVYNYVTKCLYSKAHVATNKSADIFLKSIPYFKSEKIKIDPNCRLYTNHIKKNFSGIETNATVYDAFYLEDIKNWKTNILKEETKNSSWVFIDHIYKNKESTLHWNKLKKLKEVRVSIDLFYCGIIFFRKEQEKEHFKIRY